MMNSLPNDSGISKQELGTAVAQCARFFEDNRYQLPLSAMSARLSRLQSEKISLLNQIEMR